MWLFIAVVVGVSSTLIETEGRGGVTVLVGVAGGRSQGSAAALAWCFLSS